MPSTVFVRELGDGRALVFVYCGCSRSDVTDSPGQGMEKIGTGRATAAAR